MSQTGHLCEDCGFEVTQQEMRAMEESVRYPLAEALAAFEEWRKTLNTRKIGELYS
jgi:hypothetical protein